MERTFGTQPIPEFGTPALSWHIGIQHKHGGLPSNSDVEVRDLRDVRWEKLFDDFQDKRKEFYAPFNDFLIKLQRKGRVLRGEEPQEMRLMPRESRIPHLPQFDRVEPDSLCFTLWWQDEGQNGFLADSTPPSSATRVRVYVRAFIDYITVSFYIDASKPWNAPRIYSSTEAEGVRRERTFRHVDAIRAISQQRIVPSIIELPLVPERNIDSAEAATLLDASEYLYSAIWEAFCSDFDFDLDDIVTSKGRCFVNLRSLVMSTDGLPPLGERPNPEQGGSPQFEDQKEANAVVKAFWPFVRRITPYADFRDHVACGVMNWRALLVTSVGAKTSRLQEEGEERENVPAGSLPNDVERSKPTGRGPRNQSQQQTNRYLFLTKFDPHPREIGHVVEQINRLETLRLIALKDYDFLQNASVYIGIRGRELDSITAWLNKEYADLQNKYVLRKNEVLTKARSIRWKPGPLNEAKSERDNRLSEVTEDVEIRLVKITAALDELGDIKAGGLSNSVERSTIYMRQFNELLKTLSAGEIPTWMSYGSFVERYLKPTFNMIQQTGEHFRALRTRLTAARASIQGSALVVQNSATRDITSTVADNSKKQLDISGHLTLIVSFIAVFGFFGQILQPHFWTHFIEILNPNAEAFASLWAYRIAGGMAFIAIIILFVLRKLSKTAAK
jgi:hypothetical protein